MDSALEKEDGLPGSDEDQGSEKPSEQRGGTTPDAAEAGEKGECALPPGVEGGLDAQAVYRD